MSVSRPEPTSTPKPKSHYSTEGRTNMLFLYGWTHLLNNTFIKSKEEISGVLRSFLICCSGGRACLFLQLGFGCLAFAIFT